MTKGKWDGQQVVSLTIRSLLFVASLSLLAVGTRLSMEDKTASSTVTYTAAFICLFFVFLPEFSKFKGFGLEAELREKIKEADDVLQRLRTVSMPISEMLFTMAARMGRWGAAIPRQDSYRIMKEIEEELVKLGVSHDEIDQSKHDWHRFNIRDLGLPIYRNLEEKLKNKLIEIGKITSSYPQPIKGDDLRWKQLGEDQASLHKHKKDLEQILQQPKWTEAQEAFERFINECPAFSSQERKEIFDALIEEFDDIRYYVEHRKFRRLAHWLAGY